MVVQDIAVSKCSVMVGFSLLDGPAVAPSYLRSTAKMTSAPIFRTISSGTGFEMPPSINILFWCTTGANAPGIAMLARNAGARSPVRNNDGNPGHKIGRDRAKRNSHVLNRALPNHSFRSRSSLLPLMNPPESENSSMLINFSIFLPFVSSSSCSIFSLSA